MKDNRFMEKNIKEAFKFLEEHQTAMSFNQIDFIKSLKKHFKKKRLSDRQTKALFEMKKYI